MFDPESSKSENVKSKASIIKSEHTILMPRWTMINGQLTVQKKDVIGFALKYTLQIQKYVWEGSYFLSYFNDAKNWFHNSALGLKIEKSKNFPSRRWCSNRSKKESLAWSQRVFRAKANVFLENNYSTSILELMCKYMLLVTGIQTITSIRLQHQWERIRYHQIFQL